MGSATIRFMHLPDRIRHLLSRTRARTLHIDGFRHAAVLVPFIQRGENVSLLFTVRSHKLPLHAGQISFPGGQPERGEQCARETALRESQEELGIDPATVVVLGHLDDVATPSGFLITPVVGWLHEPARFRPDAREVDELFEVALTELRDPAHFRDAGVAEHDGRSYDLPEYHVAGRVVWGATARMVQILLSRLEE
jgi:8-oxo-dGTP pyrophosphatase MutT (NUDIX family)